FRDGQKVTLDKLKAMGIVGEECTSYSVTSGSRLTTPLIICANEFSMPAIKMIALTGGRAIQLRQL
ncbi:MAG: uL15 family ribosomal protein, partial [Clostridia bacterium]|nr:uL15 family ribosomal protein [Clostridia bacterium]